MKKLLMTVAVLALTACPVACVNDPTESEETGTEVSTACTVNDQITDAVTQVCDTDTGTDTGTAE